MNYTHYTNFGVTGQPSCADGAGFVPYRPGVVARLVAGEDVPHASRGEIWIAQQELRIRAWRGQGHGRNSTLWDHLLRLAATQAQRLRKQADDLSDTHRAVPRFFSDMED